MINAVRKFFNEHKSFKKLVKVVVLGMVAQGINIALNNINLLELDPNTLVLLTGLLVALENYVNHLNKKK